MSRRERPFDPLRELPGYCRDRQFYHGEYSQAAGVPELWRVWPHATGAAESTRSVQSDLFFNIVECDPESVTSDMPVEVCFEKWSEEITIPQFRPVPADE